MGRQRRGRPEVRARALGRCLRGPAHELHHLVVDRGLPPPPQGVHVRRVGRPKARGKRSTAISSPRWTFCTGRYKEALRLHPPLILLLRSSHSDFTVQTRDGKQYDIPKDHIVATSPAFANRLPHVFKDPDRYDPERFAPGREEDKVAGPFWYISFGGGWHGCFGEPFAYLQIKAIWSHLLRNFELELVSPFPEIDWNAMVVGVKVKVMVRYKRRELSVD